MSSSDLFVSPDLHDLHPDTSNCTKYFWQVLYHRVALRNANVLIEVTGMPGLSKSWSSLEIAYWLNNWGGHTLIPSEQVSFSYGDCLEQVRTAMDGQCYMNDERPRPAGFMSDSEQDAFENVLDIVRKKRISVLLLSPKAREDLPFYTFQLTALSIHFSDEIAVFRCEAADKIYGIVQIRAPTYHKPSIILPYEKAKDAFLKNMLNRGGTTGANLQKIANRLMEDPRILKCRGMKKNLLRSVIAIEASEDEVLPTSVVGLMADYIWGQWELEDLENELRDIQNNPRKRKRQKGR